VSNGREFVIAKLIISNMAYLHGGAQEVGLVGRSYGDCDSSTVPFRDHINDDGGSSG
jgi:hypothetical protein